MIELLIALVITVFGLMGVLALHGSLAQGTGAAAQSQEAVSVAKQSIELFRSKRPPDLARELTGSELSSPPFSRPNYVSVIGRNGLTYTVDVAVSLYQTMWKIRVEVRWTDDATGEERMMPFELLRPTMEAL
jgi:hypothetical protein